MRYLERGVTVHQRDKAAQGYTLFTPLLQRNVYLIDMLGNVAHQWVIPGQPANYAYLQPDGNLLVASWDGSGPDGLAGRGGLIQEYDWNGKVVWEHRRANQHHDFRRCPSGNLVYLTWELMPEAAASRVRGGTPGSEHKDGGIWGDHICEVNRKGETVWNWRIWEHLDIESRALTHTLYRHEFGHANTIVPIGDDRVGICCRHLDWVGVIERASGKLVYQRHEPDWGGPHDFQPLANGNFMIFANRNAQVPRGSKVVEWNPTTNETVWEYWGNPSHTFDSHYISGCQRLSNGNTLICEGLWGRFFEVTPGGEIVWEYISPFTTHQTKGQSTGDQSTVFRAYRYAADGPELRGRI